MRIHTQQKMSPVAPKSPQDSRTKGLQTLPINSTLQPRTLNKKRKVYEETVKDLTLKKLGKEIKNQTPNTALRGRGSQHAPTAQHSAGRKRGHSFPQCFNRISFQEGRKKEIQKGGSLGKRKVVKCNTRNVLLTRNRSLTPPASSLNCSLLS